MSTRASRAQDSNPHDSTPSRRLRGDDGASTSLSVALLTPIFVIVMFAAFQAALWTHARTEARVIARDTAALVARADVPPGAARASAQSVLTADTLMTNINIAISQGNGVVVVTITADAPGIIKGTSRGLSVTAAVPIEEITPP
jgi:hypothetical protein